MITLSSISSRLSLLSLLSLHLLGPGLGPGVYLQHLFIGLNLHGLNLNGAPFFATAIPYTHVGEDMYGFNPNADLLPEDGSIPEIPDHFHERPEGFDTPPTVEDYKRWRKEGRYDSNGFPINGGAAGGKGSKKGSRKASGGKKGKSGKGKINQQHKVVPKHPPSPHLVEFESEADAVEQFPYDPNHPIHGVGQGNLDAVFERVADAHARKKGKGKAGGSGAGGPGGIKGPKI